MRSCTWRAFARICQLTDRKPKSDLLSLIEDRVPEGKNIEYKSALPNNSDRDKKEFLADVSAFSNSSGGYILFGIFEKSGLPVDLKGLGDIDIDAAILRFENFLRDGMKLKRLLVKSLCFIETIRNFQNYSIKLKKLNNFFIFLSFTSKIQEQLYYS